MSDAGDPKGWIPSTEGGDLLRASLARARGDIPSPSEMTSLAARLSGLGESPPIANANAKASGVVSTVGPVAKIALGTAIVAGGVFLWMVLRAPNDPSAIPSPPTPVPSPPAVTTVVASEVRGEETSRPAESAPPVLLLPKPKPVDSRIHSAPVSAPAPTLVSPPSDRELIPDGMSEAQWLRLAMDALRTDPGRALLLTRAHEHRYPTPLLTQEREVIAIEALSRLHRQDEARERGDRFRGKYPDSAHLSRINVLLNDASP